MIARDIARQRLANQYLATPTLSDAHEVVATLGAVQAQDYPSAKWALGLRAKGLTDADVERALAEGQIVRTHVLRPTWHFVSASDIRWMLALTAPRVKQAMAFYYKYNGLDEALLRRSAKVLTKALEGGRHLTRAELEKEFARAKLEATTEQRMFFMLRAELDLLVCNGVKRGKQQTYALFDERVPLAKPVQRDEAIARLTKRYFATRSPASVHDLAWWSGLTVSDAKRGIEMLGPDLERRTIGDRAYWWARDALPVPRPKPNAAHLLPNYDEYFIGFKDRSAIMEVLAKNGYGAKAPALTQHPIVLDGQVIGGWKRIVSGKEMAIQLETLTRVNEAAKRGLKAAVMRLGGFLGQRVRAVRK